MKRASPEAILLINFGSCWAKCRWLKKPRSKFGSISKFRSGHRARAWSMPSRPVADDDLYRLLPCWIVTVQAGMNDVGSPSATAGLLVSNHEASSTAINVKVKLGLTPPPDWDTFAGKNHSVTLLTLKLSWCKVGLSFCFLADESSGWWSSAPVLSYVSTSIPGFSHREWWP